MTTTIVFDLDGTLMNTLDDLHASVNHALSHAGLATCDKMTVRRLLGNGINVLIDSCISLVCPNADDRLKRDVLAEFRAYYMAHSMDHTAPYDGIMPMLAECKRLGLLTAIVSNKPDAAVRDLHREFFSGVIDIAIGESASMKRKPAPDMVHEAMAHLSATAGRTLVPEECVYVGDSEVDVATAHNACLRCVAVSWGFRDEDTLIACGAENIVSHPAELLAVIAALP